MQSYRNRRMKPESKCSGRTTQIQAGQEPTVQTLNLVATNGPCLASTNRVQFEEPEEFKLLTETCPMVLPYMPSIQRRKAHQKTQRNVRFHTTILVVVSHGGQAECFDRFCGLSWRFRITWFFDPLCHQRTVVTQLHASTEGGGSQRNPWALAAAESRLSTRPENRR